MKSGIYILIKLIISLVVMIIFVPSCKHVKDDPTSWDTPGNIKGYVRDQLSLEYLAGVEIKLGVLETETGEDGFYVLSGLTPDEYTVIADMEGYSNSASTVRVLAGDTSFANFHLIPENATGSVQGYVRDLATQKFLYNAAVSTTGNAVTTNVAGYYTLTDLSSGNHVITAYLAGYDETDLNVSVSLGEISTVNFWLEQTGGSGILTGYITSETTGNPVTNGIITVGGLNTTSDTTGYYYLPGIIPGAYMAYGSKSSYETDSAEVVIADRGTTEQDFLIRRIIPPDTTTLVWEFSNTGTNHIISIPHSINPTVNGAVLSSGDLIGIFYDDNGNHKCAGYVEWNGTSNLALAAWGDDSLTPDKDGLASNETFIWKIHITSSGLNYTASAEYFSGSGTFEPNGLSILSSLKVE